jgi:hypothetical protein
MLAVWKQTFSNNNSSDILILNTFENTPETVFYYGNGSLRPVMIIRVLGFICNESLLCVNPFFVLCEIYTLIWIVLVICIVLLWLIPHPIVIWQLKDSWNVIKTMIKLSVWTGISNPRKCRVKRESCEGQFNLRRPLTISCILLSPPRGRRGVSPPPSTH